MSKRKQAERTTSSSPQVTFAIDGVAGVVYSALREGIAIPGFLLTLVVANLTVYEWEYIASVSGTFYAGGFAYKGIYDGAATKSGDGWDGLPLAPGEFEGASTYKSLVEGYAELVCTAVSYRFRDGAGAWRYVEAMAAQQDLGTSRGVCGQIMYKPDDEMESIVRGGAEYLGAAVISRMRSNEWFTSMNGSSNGHASSEGRNESWHVSATTSMETGMTEGTVYVHQDITKTTAVGEAVMDASHTKVKSIAVTNNGSGYSAPPLIIISESQGGRSATAVPVMDAGGDRVAAVKITDPGSGYTSPPTVEFGAP